MLFSDDLLLTFPRGQYLSRVKISMRKTKSGSASASTRITDSLTPSGCWPSSVEWCRKPSRCHSKMWSQTEQESRRPHSIPHWTSWSASADVSEGKRSSPGSSFDDENGLVTILTQARRYSESSGAAADLSPVEEQSAPFLLVSPANPWENETHDDEIVRLLEYGRELRGSGIDVAPNSSVGLDEEGGGREEEGGPHSGRWEGVWRPVCTE